MAQREGLVERVRRHPRSGRVAPTGLILECQALERQPAANPGALSRFGTAAAQGQPVFGLFHLSFLPPPRGCGSPAKRPSQALFFSTFAPYIEGAGLPAMEINCRRNKPFGPGGSTRRLHQSPPHRLRVSAGAKQDRRGRKGRVFSRYCSAVIGLCNSCKRQLCSGCSGRVSGLKNQV